MKEQIAKEKPRKATDRYVDNGTLMAIVDMWWHHRVPADIPPYIKDILHDLELDGHTFKEGKWHHKTLSLPDHQRSFSMTIPVAGFEENFIISKIREIWGYFKHTPVKKLNVESMRSGEGALPDQSLPAQSFSPKDSTSQG